MYHRANQLCAIGAPERPGIVHRLDKETSGVMVVAKSDRAYHSLVDQFSSGKQKRNTWHWYVVYQKKIREYRPTNW